MSFRNTRWFLGIAVGGAIGLAANSAVAQITPDATLPNNSTVTINGNTFNIGGGTTAERNLFHSFQQFSVPNGNTASFNNAVNIQNIFSRVTGTSVSNIDGLIKASGTANLFLINPNGIIFGRNASLDVGGSFVGTTANAIQFGNQGFFSASAPNNPALLTVNPSALFFNQIAAAARIQNNSRASAGKNPAGLDALGLRVPDGKSLLLVGGNVNMNGGRLNAYGGRVELGGLAASGNVGLNVDGGKLSLDFPASSTRADISLTNGAGVYVEAGGGGDIAIYSRYLNVSGGSLLSAGIGQGLGNAGAKAGDITLNATGYVYLDGSSIFNIVGQQATGNGGNINITTTGTFSSTYLNDAQVKVGSDGNGAAGKITSNSPFIFFIIIFSAVDPINGLVSLPAYVFDPSNQIAQGCAAFDQPNASDFQVTGRGGLPPSPDEPLSSDAVWEDTRLGATTPQRLDSKTTATKPKSESDTVEIIPATGWVFNGKGEVTLVSHTPNATAENLAASSQSCRFR
jgi:filamentous hemagglutinin family protein